MYHNAKGADERLVKETEIDGQPARLIESSRTYATDRDDLWDALTNPERLPRWFNPVSGDFEEGGRFQIEGNASGTITTCAAPERLELTWEYGGGISWVSVRLSADEDHTRLTLSHSWLKGDSDESAVWAQYGPGAGGVGWDLSLFGLGIFSEQDDFDREAAEAWMGTDEGKAFFRRCADAWCDAHVRSGEARDVAQRMADETFAFYTSSA